MLDGRWEDALQELIGLRAPESEQARTWRGAAHDFFSEVDRRTSSFYLAAHASVRWKARLSAEVARVCGDEQFPVLVVDVEYRYVASPLAALRLAVAVDSLPLPNYGRRTPRADARTHDRGADDDERGRRQRRPGVRWQVLRRAAILPSIRRCAAAAIRQLMAFRQLRTEKTC